MINANYPTGDIDPGFRTTAGTETARLKDVTKALFEYIKTNCKDLESLLTAKGLSAFVNGKDGDTLEVQGTTNQLTSNYTDYILKLVTMLLMAAVLGPERKRYLLDIQKTFDPSIQFGLQHVIEQKMALINSHVASTEVSTPTHDHELEFEERYASLLQSKSRLEAENARLSRKIDGMQSSLDRVQINYDDLKTSHKVLESQLDEIASRGDTASMVDALRRDIQDRDDLIASQEASLESSRVFKEQAQDSINRMKAGADELIKVKDELRAVTRENAKLLKANTELEKKANMADHYRRKLESVRDYEGECAELKRINDDLQKDCEDVARLRHQNKAQERRISDFERALSTNESEIYELTMTKNTVQEQVIFLQNKNNSLEQAIADLREARDNNDSPRSARAFGNLEDELNDGIQGESDTMVIAALRAQIDILKKNSSAAQDSANLRIQLNDAENVNKELTKKCNEQFEKIAIQEQQVRAILDKSTGEGLVLGTNAALLIGELNMLTPEYYRTEAFSKLRKAHDAATDALAALQKKFDETTSELEQAKRDLLDARTDRKSKCHGTEDVLM